jgi:hypothetical protein
MSQSPTSTSASVFGGSQGIRRARSSYQPMHDVVSTDDDLVVIPDDVV